MSPAVLRKFYNFHCNHVTQKLLVQVHPVIINPDESRSLPLREGLQDEVFRRKAVHLPLKVMLKQF